MDELLRKMRFRDLGKTSGVPKFQRKTLVDKDKRLENAIKLRGKFTIIHKSRDATPKTLTNSDIMEFDELPQSKEQYQKRKTIFTATSRVSEVARASYTATNITLDNIAIQIAPSASSSEIDLVDEYIGPPMETPRLPKFIKIILKETENIELFESPSITVTKDSDEAKIVEEANENYEYLTVGKGKNRRTSEAEAQTTDILYKSRSANTERIKKLNVTTFVSNYDMYDTYADLNHFTQSCESLDKNTKIDITTYSTDGLDDIINVLNQSESFRLASMVLQRLLAGNVFRERQKRFRNMYKPSPLDLKAKYLYRLETLWTYKTLDTLNKPVSCASWCQSNGDLIAIGYGVYGFKSYTDRSYGYVCVWSIKNPVNPERKYKYRVPVTAVSFSKQNPQLLAIALYDGSVEIRDIADEHSNSTPVGKSHRSTSPGFEPIWQIKWIPGEDLYEVAEDILTVSEDGRVMKYSLTNGPYLIGCERLHLDRIEGVIEGLRIVKKKEFLEAYRHPQGLCLTIHPQKSDIYFVGTDEGCLHKCSTNYPHQHTGTMQVHNGGVFCMEFSPWSPKIFLTCGSDWCIRIWIDEIFEPICELSSSLQAVQCAFWSPIHSTIIASCTKTSVEIWDLRRRALKPASIHTFGAGSIPLTIVKFTNDGSSLIVGDGEGTTHVCALEDMPFSPYNQYNELQSSLYKIMVANPERLKLVKSLGYLGY